MAKTHAKRRKNGKNWQHQKDQRLTEVILKPERMLHRAMALGRLENGQIALLQGALPDETVRAEVAKVKGVFQGQVLEVLEASPFRRTEQPQHPGLDYGFIDDAHQLVLKADVVQDVVNRQGVVLDHLDNPNSFAVRAAPNVWNYRYTVQPAASKEGLGYRKSQSHDLVLLDSDPVAHPAINAVWPKIQDYLPTEKAKGLMEIAFRVNDDNEVLACLIARASLRNYMELAHELVDSQVLAGVSYSQFDSRGRFYTAVERLAGKRRLGLKIGDAKLSVSASEFSQPNPEAAGILFQTLKQWIEGLGLSGHAVDLFGGSGVIGYHLKDLFESVTVLDISSSSLKLGEQEATEQGISNLHFKKVNAKHLSAEEIADLSLLCVDPPRAGLSKELRSAIAQAKPSYLAYVSCDITTWARDVASLGEQGFDLIKMEAFDFYPQTHHIEMLSLLKLRG